MSPLLNRGADWSAHHAPLLPAMESAFRAAVKVGVKIVTGTDSAGRHAEDVEMMREYGRDVKESLLACTKNAAEALGRIDEIGTIEKGKVADMVILDGDPLADPCNLEAVSLVIQGGKAIKPDDVTLHSLVWK
jgi:imidazolonepropionase-like amidohydrolase